MWSKNKLRRLIKHYPYTDDAELARELKMSKAMVIAKAQELGLEKEEIVEQDLGEAKLQEIEPKWKSTELDLLTVYYSTNPNSALAKELGKTKFEIEHMAYRMGLKKADGYYNVTNSYAEDMVVKVLDDRYHIGLAPSRGHYILGEILRTIYPNYHVIGEEPIEGLRIDWYMPQLKLAFEFHGKQHEVFNDFHYKNKFEFWRAQERDYEKSELCELEGIGLVRFYYNEKLSFGLVRAKIDDVL